MGIKTRFKLFVLLAIVPALLVAAGCGGTSKAAAASATPSSTPAPGATPTPGGPLPSPTPTPAPTPNGSGVPHSAHVVLVIEENHSFAEVLQAMPWLTSMGT